MKNILFIPFLSILFIGCTKNLQPLPEISDNQVDIMSFNLRYDNYEDGINRWSNRKEACIKMLNEQNPSIFGIQEGLKHQVDYLKENLPQYDSYGIGRDDGEDNGEFASIFYKTDDFLILDKGTFWLSKTPEIPSIGWDAVIKRICTWIKLKKKSNGQIIYTFNTHFDHKGKQARIESAKLIVKKILQMSNINDNLYFVGDFNGMINQKMFNPILEEFKNARKHAQKKDQTKSFNFFGRFAGVLNRNIDFIFYKNSFPQDYRVITKNYGVAYISDHYPIICRFQLETN
jgi:endonuclease/exonuclease/phosphatase family metal-dependent hydrolase